MNAYEEWYQRFDPLNPTEVWRDVREQLRGVSEPSDVHAVGTSCKHCMRPRLHHGPAPERKCLFESTCYEPLGYEAARVLYDGKWAVVVASRGERP